MRPRCPRIPCCLPQHSSPPSRCRKISIIFHPLKEFLCFFSLIHFGPFSSIIAWGPNRDEPGPSWAALSKWLFPPLTVSPPYPSLVLSLSSILSLLVLICNAQQAFPLLRKEVPTNLARTAFSGAFSPMFLLPLFFFLPPSFFSLLLRFFHPCQTIALRGRFFFYRLFADVRGGRALFLKKLPSPHLRLLSPQPWRSPGGINDPFPMNEPLPSTGTLGSFISIFGPQRFLLRLFFPKVCPRSLMAPGFPFFS